jgi:hypothetical protein
MSGKNFDVLEYNKQKSISKILEKELKIMFLQYRQWIEKIEKALKEKPYLYQNISNNVYSLEIEKIRLRWQMIKALITSLEQDNEITIEDAYTLMVNCLGIIKSILDYEQIELGIENE